MAQTEQNFPAAPIVHTQDKYFWVLKNGAALIEDLPEHIIKLQTIAPVLVPDPGTSAYTQTEVYPTA